MMRWCSRRILIPMGPLLGTVLALAGCSMQATDLAPADVPQAVAAPSMSPVAGSYDTAQRVSLSAAGPGATVFYTTDGSTPTTASMRYTGPVDVENSETIHALAVNGEARSAVTSASYLIFPAYQPPSRIVFQVQPSSVTSGHRFAPITVAVENSLGAVVDSANNSVTLSLMGNGVLEGTTTVEAVNGIATFSNLVTNGQGTEETLLATSPYLVAARSSAFTVYPQAVAGLPAVQAASADSFVDSIGLNVHFSYIGSIYVSQTQQMIDAIQALGVRHLRDQMQYWGDSRDVFSYEAHQQLAKLGVRTEFQLTAIDQPMAQVLAFPGLVDDMEAVEPSNEYDASGDPEWAADITAQQAQLYTAIKENPATAQLTVIAPSLAQPEYAPQLGDIGADADVGDSHAYFQGWNPGNDGIYKNNPAYFMAKAAINVPDKPVWVTETGFWSQQLMYWGGAGNGEALSATYMPRALLEFWNAGAQRTYLYELADYNPADFFGLIRSDGSRKPAFAAIANLIALLKEPGASFTPGSLAYALTGDTTNVHEALFEKSDGTFYLVLWVEASGMNVSTLADENVPDQDVTLQLEERPGTAMSYAWSAGGTVTTTSLTPGTSLHLTVGPNITVVALR